MKQSILIIDDEPSIRSSLFWWLGESGYDAHAVGALAEARRAVMDRCFDAVIVDNVLPDGRGIDFIDELRVACPAIAIVLITGAADIPLAVEAMQRGADNFLAKPVDLNNLNTFLQKSLELSGLRRRTQTAELLEKRSPVDFGVSAAMRQVMELAGLAAGSDVPVLVTGETGVGKGVLARWVHDSSGRRRQPFVDVNCSALRGDLLASELFGHAKGAFTSAVRERQGLIEAADGGTLFLDEIGDMDLAVQAQLLKVIEEKNFRRLGEVRIRWSDFRLVCATNRDLAAEADRGRFRKDLFYRLNGLQMQVPPLRERTEDIPGLARHLLAASHYRYRDLSDDVLRLIVSYPWPGNVREVRNILERAVLLARGGPLRPEHFSGLREGDHPRVMEAVPASPARELDRMERDCIEAALHRFNGNVDQAAELLGISRATVYRRIKKYGARTR